MENYHLELWPGYQTSIRQHETDILLCAEITHKVMRTDTLHHILKDCISEGAEFQTAFKRQIIGEFPGNYEGIQEFEAHFGSVCFKVIKQSL